MTDVVTDCYQKSTSVKKHDIWSDPISADPSCPLPSLGEVRRGRLVLGLLLVPEGLQGAAQLEPHSQAIISNDKFDLDLLSLKTY